MKKTFLMLATLAVLIVAGAKPVAAYTRQQADTVGQGVEVGKVLPAFGLQGSNGKPLKSSAVKGRVVLIDFWASWCMPCRASIPHLKELYKKYQKSGFEILSVSIDQNSRAWKSAMLKEAMPWQQAIDKYEAGKDASVMMNALGIQSVPFALLLDDSGKVIAVNPAAEDIDALLKKIFNS
ncbi:TlpA family protein disulfide reductase [Mucilaginibacter celer]|uniref:TlpA family protein disulfide reductase n=1 Tax=Mucilaginibacter celer TaxID=2305508 RepID=A0A494VRC4_9SPHI|nr:TlpA disulfide reductase family protein [Mucilaginibacter celer]AYL93883.1 TlpA family protein disulfide reductase [Mucilaginibacter celer]